MTIKKNTSQNTWLEWTLVDENDLTNRKVLDRLSIDKTQDISTATDSSPTMQTQFTYHMSIADDLNDSTFKADRTLKPLLHHFQFRSSLSHLFLCLYQGSVMIEKIDNEIVKFCWNANISLCQAKSVYQNANIED